jgi:hypothetical protein
MQYKIPIQIENEDTIVLGLSLRQLVIIMVWSGVAYGLFKYLEPRLGSTPALVFAIPIVVTGIVIALIRIYEMTFLPTILNAIRLSLNGRARPWAQGTDSFSELDIGYIMPTKVEVNAVANKSFSDALAEKDDFAEKIKHL